MQNEIYNHSEVEQHKGKSSFGDRLLWVVLFMIAALTGIAFHWMVGIALVVAVGFCFLLSIR